MGAKNGKPVSSKQEVTQVISNSHFSKEEILSLSDDFQKAAAGDGKPGLSESEFIKFFGVRFQHWDEESIKSMFKSFDTDGSGSIDFKEFTSALYLMTKAPILEKLGFLFDVFDSDKSGYLSMEEGQKLIDVAISCGTALGIGSYNENTDFAFDIISYEKCKSLSKGISREEFITAASASDKFCRMVSFGN